MDTIWPSRPIATVHRPFFDAPSTAAEKINLIAAAAGPAAGRFPEDWSSGDHLVINQDTPNATAEIWLTTASGTGEPRLLKRAGRQTGGGRISPNGRWLAYVSNESGAFEVYVSPLNGSSKQTVSTAGGVHPRWRADGSELLYIGGDRALMSVSVASGDTFKAGSPTRLFASCLTGLPNFYAGGFELARDGSTFWLCPGSGMHPERSRSPSTGWRHVARRASMIDLPTFPPGYSTEPRKHEKDKFKGNHEDSKTRRNPRHEIRELGSIARRLSSELRSTRLL